MRRITKTIAAIAAAGALVLGLAACDGAAPAPTTRDSQLAESEANFESRRAPDVTGDAEYQNYIKAQEEVYDDPASIIWCTAAFPSAAAPIFTVPIAGKLTSSSVSFYPNQTLERADLGEYNGDILVEAQSVDGMYHGSPGPYRYGFTPGGQYVDFTGLSTFCTTALTEFQRQTLEVSAAADNGVTDQAEEALRNGDPTKAQEITDGAAG
ncbi:MAG: hypothetical protein K0Q52_201 [Microbacterium sp.]|jgi:hypothetical protein|nr:hypothetical protein [Microbacterium sp.]